MPWVAVLLGGLAGAVMGALGGGGAILTIPILIYILGMPPRDATTASLVIVGMSAAVTAVGHVRRRTARVLDALLLAGVGTVGTYAGSLAAAAVPGAVLVVLLAALLAVVGALMLTGGTEAPEVQAPEAPEVQAPEAPASPRTSTAASAGRRVGPVVAVGLGVGLLTGFFGVGGGFAIVPALRLVLGYPIRTAVGTSLLVIAINSATALASRVAHGVSLDWPLVALFTVGAVAGGLLGGRVARQVRPQVLSKGFAALLFGVAAYMLGSAVMAR